MYNVNYYSRRGRTIERKKVDSGQVINPRLIPIYYNYLKDNGMFPSAPPPPVHVDDGTCIAFDYSPAQSYSFPEVSTLLTDALGTLLFNLGIDVDIAKVDHINLSFYVTTIQSNYPALYISVTSSPSSSNSLNCGTFNGSTTSNPYTLTFVRDYSQSGTVFCFPGTFSSPSGSSKDLDTLSPSPVYIRQTASSDVYITRIVVATLTE